MSLVVLRNTWIRDGNHQVGGFYEGWPCEGPITQVFGGTTVTDPTGVHRHAGDDIGVRTGTPLYAWDYGEVQNQDWGDFGKHVYLRHGWDELLERDVNGIVGHCSQINIVPNGKRVAPGELIAISGNTGLSFGDHVHFGFGDFFISGDYRRCIDPEVFIKRAEQEEDLPMAPYERGLLSIAFGDPTVMSTEYDGLDAAHFFDAINASDGVAPPFLGESDPVKQLNAVSVRRNRIAFLATDVVNGPKAWEAVN